VAPKKPTANAFRGLIWVVPCRKVWFEFSEFSAPSRNPILAMGTAHNPPFSMKNHAQMANNGWLVHSYNKSSIYFHVCIVMLFNWFPESSHRFASRWRVNHRARRSLERLVWRSDTTLGRNTICFRARNVFALFRLIVLVGGFHDTCTSIVEYTMHKYIYIGRLEMGCLKLGYPKSTGLSIIIITYCIFEIFCVHQVFRHTHRLIADIISRYTVFWPFPLKIEWWVMIFTLSCTISLNHQGLIGITWGMSSSKKTHPRPMEYIDCFWWYYCFCPHNWKPKRYVSWKLILWYSSVFVAIVLPVWTIIATSQRPQRTQHTWCETIGVIKPDVVQIYELQNNITSGKHVWW